MAALLRFLGLFRLGGLFGLFHPWLFVRARRLPAGIHGLLFLADAVGPLMPAGFRSGGAIPVPAFGAGGPRLDWGWQGRAAIHAQFQRGRDLGVKTQLDVVLT